MGLSGYTYPPARPMKDRHRKVANRTKWVMPSIALVSPSLRLIVPMMRVIETMTVWIGVIAITTG